MPIWPPTYIWWSNICSIKYKSIKSISITVSMSKSTAVGWSSGDYSTTLNDHTLTHSLTPRNYSRTSQREGYLYVWVIIKRPLSPSFLLSIRVLFRLLPAAVGCVPIATSTAVVLFRSRLWMAAGLSKQFRTAISARQAACGQTPLINLWCAVFLLTSPHFICENWKRQQQQYCVWIWMNWRFKDSPNSKSGSCFAHINKMNITIIVTGVRDWLSLDISHAVCINHDDSSRAAVWDRQMGISSILRVFFPHNTTTDEGEWITTAGGEGDYFALLPQFSHLISDSSI